MGRIKCCSRTPPGDPSRTGQSKNEGRPLPAFYLYSMPLSSPPAEFGDNELRLRLTKNVGTANLVAQEFEILVKDSRNP